MSDYTRVVMESDAAGRIGISVLDADGGGHGHRIVGPKYVNDVVFGRHATVLGTKELDGRDVDAIRLYLRHWDEIHLVGHVSRVFLELSDALDRYLGNAATQLRCPDHQERPHNVERNQRTRDGLVSAIAAVSSELVRTEDEPGGDST